MSKVTIKKHIADGLLAALSKEANVAARKVMQQGGRAQVIQLKDLEFINKTIESIKESDKKYRKKQRRIKKLDFSAQDIQDARDLAKAYQDRFVAKVRSAQGKFGPSNILTVYDTPQFKRLYDTAGTKHIAESIKAGESFIVISFSALTGLKSKIVDKALESTSKALREEVKRKVTKGHGTEGGTAVSGVQLAQAQAAAQEEGIDLAKIPGLESYLLSEFQTYKYIDNAEEMAKIVKDIFIDYKTLVDSKGNLVTEYVPIITFQDWFTNQGVDSKMELFVKETVSKFFKKTLTPGELILLDGSKNFVENVETLVVNTLVGKRKNKRRKVTRRLDSKINTSKKQAKTKGKKPSNAGLKSTKKKTGGMPSGITRKPSQKTQNSAIPLSTFIGILNSKLPATVAKNMGSPALNYMTGRFASSVQVTDIVYTPQGFPSVGYTYQKSPYQTFEPGFRQGSPDRDPRVLIDKSIRELAAQLVTGRLYTRRV